MSIRAIVSPRSAAFAHNEYLRKQFRLIWRDRAQLGRNADLGADCARRANQCISSDSGLPKPAHGLKNRMRGNGNLRSQFKLICAVQSCPQKYSASMSASIDGYLLPSRTR
jgi:hypothetical protein